MSDHIPPGSIDMTVDCPWCSVTIEADALCDCDVDPCCVRCHRVYHVEVRGRWSA
jgi:hypothetical protein